jgi:hypothetical protein
MCFDTTSSLTAWSISILISIYLFYRGKRYDRWNAAFITSFSTIQLLEAGLWKTIRYDKVIDTKTNELLTKGILLTLLSQPLVQTAMASFNISDNQRFGKTILHILSFVLLGILFYGIFRVGDGDNSFKSEVGKKGHLMWQSYNKGKKTNFLGGWWVGALYLIGLFLPMFFMEGSIALLLIGVMTFITSLIYARGEEFGSFWCFTAVAYSFAALFV